MKNSNPMPDFVLIDKDKPDLVKRLMVRAAIVTEKAITKFESELFAYYEKEKICRNNRFECEYNSLKE